VLPGQILEEHKTHILVTCQAWYSVITLGLMGIGIEDIWQVKYGPSRRFICRLRDTDREHKTIVHGIMVLCKIMEDIRLIEILVPASRTDFGRTQNSYSRNQSFV